MIALRQFPGIAIAALVIAGVSPDTRGEEESTRIRFTTLSKSTPSGLKSNHVRDITQDLSGYVWIATDQGLTRFDGWESLHFQKEFESSSGLSSNQISAVTTSSEKPGPIWIGTSSDGLMRLDQPTGHIERITTATGKSMLSDTIIDLAISKDDRLWIGTDRGLNVLDQQTGEMSIAEGKPGSARIASVNLVGDSEVWIGTHEGELYRWNAEEETFGRVWETAVPVSAVVEDAAGTVWIGTKGDGLYSYSPDRSPKPEKVTLGAVHINSLLIDSKNNDLWVGSRRGVAFFDRDNDSFLWFRSDPRRIDSLANNHVSEIFEDHSEMLWISTLGGGTSRFSLDRRWFSHIRMDPGNAGKLPASPVQSLTYGPDGNVWLGTDNGLSKWDPEALEFADVPEFRSVEDANISSLHWDRNGTLWMGTLGDGLVRRESDGRESIFEQSASGVLSIGHDNISVVYGDDVGRLLVGTSGGGLWSWVEESERFAMIESEVPEDSSFVADIEGDTNGNLWVAGNNKLLVLTPGGGKLEDYRKIFPAADPLSSPLVSNVLAESNGIVWVGTSDSGLDRLNTGTGEVSNYNRAIHGLPDDEIMGLAKDASGLLWVMTRTGLARLNAMQDEFRIFNADDGLQRAGFNPLAVTRTDDGVLYFGGLDGFNIVDPANLPEVPGTPTPILTGLDYYGETVVPKKGGILEKQIAATGSLDIPYDSRSRFAIRFGNLDYRFPNSGQFRYKLEGHDEEWRYAEGERKASYSGLAPGGYTFLVQSTLDPREWPENSVQIGVNITPPWWNELWFKLLAGAIVILGAIESTRLFFRARFKQHQRRELRLTAERDRAEAVLARQLQNRLLLDRTSRELHNELSESQILNDALHSITEQFGATHCLIHRLEEIPGEEGDEAQETLKQIGYWTVLKGAPDQVQPRLQIDFPLVAEVLESTSAIAITDKDSLPQTIRAPFTEHESVSLLSFRTSFLDKPNGIVTMLRVGQQKSWNEEDTKLIEALAGQFGIVIAQIKTAATEEIYLRFLEKSRHDAEVANRAKTDFLAKMTHELRTPLNAIIGFSEILGEDKTLNPRQRETLDIINNSGEHLLDVINEILDLSKIEAGKIEKNYESFNLVTMLKSVYEMLALKAKDKRIGFHFSTASSALPGEILTDRSKLRQILINLIGNAIKFTAQGAVSLSVKAVALDEADDSSGQFERPVRLEFEIRDTGRGISAGEIPKLFERYSQTESGRRSTEGTGLGLPIARSFVQLLGGDIVVESIVGEGTIFRFHIECSEIAASEEDQAKAGTALDETTAQRIIGFESAHEEVRILIAEDQPTNRLLLKKILGKAGFKLEEAENGQEAIEKWNDWKPHLILMDEDMPLKKGSEATREIKSLCEPDSGPVIVALTAYALEQARISAMESGCSDFVAKPFRSHELFSVISRHLNLDYVFKDAA